MPPACSARLPAACLPASRAPACRLHLRAASLLGCSAACLLLFAPSRALGFLLAASPAPVVWPPATAARPGLTRCEASGPGSSAGGLAGACLLHGAWGSGGTPGPPPSSLVRVGSLPVSRPSATWQHPTPRPAAPPPTPRTLTWHPVCPPLYPPLRPPQVSRALEHVEEGHKMLQAAKKAQRSTRKWACCITVFILIIIAIIVLVVFMRQRH